MSAPNGPHSTSGRCSGGDWSKSDNCAGLPCQPGRRRARLHAWLALALRALGKTVTCLSEDGVPGDAEVSAGCRHGSAGHRRSRVRFGAGRRQRRLSRHRRKVFSRSSGGRVKSLTLIIMSRPGRLATFGCWMPALRPPPRLCTLCCSRCKPPSRRKLQRACYGQYHRYRLISLPERHAQHPASRRRAFLEAGAPPAFISEHVFDNRTFAATRLLGSALSSLTQTPTAGLCGRG